VIITKLDRWKNATGGCTTHTLLPPIPENPVPERVEDVPVTLNPTPTPDTHTTLQQPGTFVFLYENETEKVYSYVVKNGGIPDGVRAQYVKKF